MNLDDLISTLLKSGQTDELYNAIDSGDAVEIIKAADRAIIKLNLNKGFRIVHKKSLYQSKEYRDLGNSYFRSRKYKAALLAYNIALAYAPPGTLEMLFAMSNRSAVLFTMRSYTNCLSDIQKCLTMGSPPELATKLKKRLLKVLPYVQVEIQSDMNFHNQFVSTFFEKEFLGRNDVACASSDVNFITNDGLRQITATREISPGKIVAIEPAFVTCDSNDYDFLSCYYCNKLLLNPIPCDKCCYAMFCSEKCQNLCMSDYHSVECPIVDFLEKIYSDHNNTLIIRAAIKLSLNLGWKAFIAASENIGSSQMKAASTRETYSIDEPISILSYDDNQELLEGRTFNGSVICAIVLGYFDDLPNYFPKASAQRAAAKKAMSKILFHLYVHFPSTVRFTNSAYDYKSDAYKCVMQESMGWFSMTGKMKHSCAPNLLVVGLKDRIALLSIRTIKKGEELTISFINCVQHIALSLNKIENIRATHIFLQTRKTCSCNVFTDDWIYNDLKEEPMTDRQADLNRRFQSVTDIHLNVYKHFFQLVCEMLDSFSVKSKQYQEAYRVLNVLLNLCQCKQSSNQVYETTE